MQRTPAPSETSSHPPARDRAAAWVLGLAVLLLVVQVSTVWYVSRDGASYLSIARSLAHGAGPTNLGREQLFFAPGYSFLIAPTFWLGEYPFLWISLLHALLAIAWLGLTKKWLAQFATADAVILTAVCVTNVSVGILLRKTLSEALFMPALVAGALALAWLRTATELRQRLGASLAVGLGLAGLCLARQVGVMLLPGFTIAVAVWCGRRRIPWGRAALTILFVAIPPVAAILLLGAYERSVADPTARTYVDFFPGAEHSFAEQALLGARMRISEIGRVVVPGLFKSSTDGGGARLLNLVLFAATVALIARGWWRAVRASHDALLWSVPFYLALYVVWPFDEGIRFMAPYAPVWFLGLYLALPENPLSRRRLSVIFFGMHAVVAVGYWLSDDRPDAIADAAQWPQIQQLAAQIDEDHDRVGWLPAKVDRQRVMLQYELDRPVADLAATGVIDAQCVWIIAKKDAPIPDGFQRVEVTDSYVLLRRNGTE
jgi:4-amino-4-deoxy-L-arabinose transferase-like glycosyltransferase